MSVCPECDGARMVDHPSRFQFSHTATCELRRFEDQRKVADVDELMSRDSRVLRSVLYREPTETELKLLEACGIDPLDVKEVEFRAQSPAIRERRFYREDGSHILIPGDDAPPAPSGQRTGIRLAASVGIQF